MGKKTKLDRWLIGMTNYHNTGSRLFRIAFLIFALGAFVGGCFVKVY